MQCHEFREISESYLDDELLIETNHRINQHLEQCGHCSEDFAASRELRKRVNLAGKNAPDFMIDPAFNRNLEASLKQIANRPRFSDTIWPSAKFWIPALGLLLLGIGIAIVDLNNKIQSPNALNNSIVSGLAEMARLAAGSHEDCAIQKINLWETMSRTDYPDRSIYSQKVLAPLKAGYSDQIEMLSVHDCEYLGKRFTHVVLRNNGRILSVFFDRSGSLLELNDSQMSPIISEVENGLQVAGFANLTQSIFVVSDLPESENLSLARTISQSLRQNS